MGRHRKIEKKDQNYYIPTLDEVKAYWATFDWIDFSAEYFYNHFEGVGWKVGKARIRSWKATFDCWRNNAIAVSRNAKGTTTMVASRSNAYRKPQVTAEERLQQQMRTESAIQDRLEREQAEREARLEEDRKNSVSYEEYLAMKRMENK